VSRRVCNCSADLKQGSIERIEQDKFKVGGIIEKVDDTTLDILELPVRKWTQDFKEMIEEMTTGVEKVPAIIKVSYP
jgi:DNA topoisomerase-2